MSGHMVEISDLAPCGSFLSELIVASNTFWIDYQKALHVNRNPAVFDSWNLWRSGTTGTLSSLAYSGGKQLGKSISKLL